MKPEILSPAGDFEKLRYAVRYGADAVYLAGKAYGMRTASGNFDEEELCSAIDHCHKNGVRVYVTVNTMPRNDEIAGVEVYLKALSDIKPDALIIADIGVLALAKKHCPDIPIHISTQASVVNYESAMMWHSLGAERVVLARELSVEEIAGIRAKTPKSLKLEAFVHGAMCMAYSGRCMISNYMVQRDPNRGACAQPCRWKYHLMEETRPGEFMPVYEDGQGAYILNSKDMCMIEHIPELCATGIDSLKIEGRVKSFYYTAIVTNAYRRALDMYFEDKNNYVLPEAILQEVYKISHREYYTGFYFGDSNCNRVLDSEYFRTWDVCAVVESCADKQAVLVQKNRFAPGDELELLIPFQDAIAFSPEEITDMEGCALAAAPHPHMRVKVRLPVSAPEMSVIRRRSPIGNRRAE